MTKQNVSGKKAAQKVIVIGSGFASLSAACHLAAAGLEVKILEKNSTAGGRARQFSHEGFVFDMGPSWYWMPDVFEQFFAHFGKKVSDYYDLKRLDPSYIVHFGPNDAMSLPADMNALEALFEQYEPGSAVNLRKFLKEAAYKYQVGMRDFVQKPSRSLLEFADFRILTSLFRLQMFSSISKHVRALFRNEKLIQLLEFPVLFLGATPQKTPALYSLMNYADMSLGTWYPMGGMHKIIEGMVSLARELGVSFEFNHEIAKIDVENGLATGVTTSTGAFYPADLVVGGADYQHIESTLLAPEYRNYSNKYWEDRTMAPSCLLYYVGVDKRLKNLLHHNLFFDADFGRHAHEIYESPQWPDKPLFYVSAPSVTDPSVAPEGCENLFLLIPVAPGLEDTEAVRDRYFELIMDRLEQLTEQSIRPHIVYKRSYAHADFVSDYHAFRGNAYGLANTLLQTAFLKPGLKNRKVANLYYTGQTTVPGPGVPPSLISGEVVSREVVREWGNR
ncbi:MAG: phytoene desaturase [Lewinellaceae bacterium]|nr:phytoene desaturase [Lewinellaceae bacterium]